MKRKYRFLLPMLILTMVFSSINVFALNYSGNFGNEATFETMAEVRENAPGALQPFYSRYNYVPHPVMENYPLDKTFVYRSPDMYGITAATRINTNIAVFTDQSFESKDDAFAYLEGLGLIEKINEIRGSIILVTPSNPETGFTAADQKYYYALQTAIFAVNASGTNEAGETVTYVDGAYYGGYSYYYVIGIDGGATFLNNYVVGNIDYASRIAGLLLIGGHMDRIRKVSAFLPVYIVNGDEDVIAKYEEINGTDSIIKEGAKVTYYNQVYPLRKVVTLFPETLDTAAVIDDAYYNLFLTAQRGQEMTGGIYSASTPYQGYGADCAPYSLSPRNPVLNGKTREGICFFTCVEDIFDEVKTEEGEYLQTWYEYIPEEALDGSVKDGSIPLILACHGGGDDPRQFVEGQGFLDLAGRERIAIVSPEKAKLHTTAADGSDYLSYALPALVRHVLEKYPALDPSRVYVTGYSMGALATARAMLGAPELFAAAYPQCGGFSLLEGDAERFEGIELPFVVSTAEYNFGYNQNVGFCYNLASIVSELNHMGPFDEPDFEKYPIGGFDADLATVRKQNDDYTVYTFLKANDKGIPMVGVMYIDSIVHCLYPQYSNILWDFFKHYSRNQDTLEIEYNPYA